MSPRVPPPVDGVVRAAQHIAREAFFIGAGLAVLTFQEMQVRRREWERSRRADATT